MQTRQNWLIWLILTTTLIRVSAYTTIGSGPTALWWLIEFSIIILLAVKSSVSKNNRTVKTATPVKYLLIWNTICIIRGVFIAENYWEFKSLINTGLMFFIPLIVYVCDDFLFLRKLISKWLKYMPWLFLLFLPIVFTSIKHADIYGEYFVPILFLLPFVFLLPMKYRLIILCSSILIILVSLDARSNIIRFSAAFLLGLAFYFKRLISPKLLQVFSFSLYVIPIILLILGLSGKFNIFKMDEYIQGDYTTEITENGKTKKASLTNDTRTFLYVEALGSALKNNYILFGRTPSRGYDSVSFGNEAKFVLKTGKQERFGSEVAILNIFTWNGLIGVILYFLVFAKASFLALYRSKNYIVKLLGVFVAFRWAYSFAEEFTIFGLQYIFLWITIGICYSTKFRGMNNTEIKIWASSIFEKRYRKIEYLIYKKRMEWLLKK
ncbi:hypothetical protein [Algibacter lectus]|uniref:Oligosaccharide repeat unit polymerase Wzy n=1 Tax=Algibacter lectus TaxID=221126 RepID=A0A4R8M682_9FLAO|nr:hypothetical protein [Algibacter lectus]MWW25908.1 hypothetical protein [Algibacter lectus]TDY60634.1 hypothetical protein DFQ06_3215 [Algibacter lectus]